LCCEFAGLFASGHPSFDDASSKLSNMSFVSGKALSTIDFLSALLAE
jgi:hypothetical protein